MRSVMNGSICWGLVNAPVKLYSATEDHDLTSHLVHAKDRGKIEYRKVCADCGETVHTADLAKMFTIDDKSVMLADDDLSTIDAGKSREISVLEFIPAGSIDPMTFDKPYFAGPGDKTAHKAYALLVDVLRASELVAVVRFTLRGKNRLATLGVTGKGVLLIHTLRWAEEIRTPDIDIEPVSVSDAERTMAKQLVESMTAETWNPDRYQDNYRVELRELVLSKMDAGEPAPDDVSDLLAKLESSIKGATEAAAPALCKMDIRTWARSKGYQVGQRGRIPKEITDEYQREVVA